MTEAGPSPAAPGGPSNELEVALNEALKGLNCSVEHRREETIVNAPPPDLVAVCRALTGHPRLAFDYLRCISGVDWVTKLQVVYHLWSTRHRHRLVVKVDLAPEAPSLPSVTSVWGGADWHEREAAELFGIAFEGHPNLKPLLLFEGIEGYPMRKSYPQGVKDPTPLQRDRGEASQ